MKYIAIFFFFLTSLIASSSTFKLSWNDTSDNEAGFRILRSEDAINYSIIGTTTDNVTSFTDDSVDQSKSYWYKVAAFNVEGESLSESIRGLGFAVNLSTRGYVANNDEVMIGGFVIKNGPRKVLIRGVGPSLSKYGIDPYLNDPHITLYKNVNGVNSVMLSINDWNNNPAIIDAANKVGTSQLDADSKDAAAVLILQEGVYTIIVSPFDSKPGIGLVEVFFLNSL